MFAKRRSMSLFKYVDAERIDILQNAHIRFTQPIEYNDPFELYPRFELLGYDEHIRNTVKEFLKKTNRLCDECLQKDVGKCDQVIKRIAESSINEMVPKAQRDFLSSLMGKMYKICGIVSLTEKSDNLLMWAHYSDGHKGFVIEFDEKNSYFCRNNFKKIRYEEQRPKVILCAPNSGLDNSDYSGYLESFYVKSKHWEFEQEWRMINNLSNCKWKTIKDGHEIYLYPLPLECIKGIIIGCRMSDKNKYNLVRLLKSDKKYFHIKLYCAEVNEKEFKIDKIETNIDSIIFKNNMFGKIKQLFNFRIF